MPRALVTNDWRILSKAARREHNPKKFIYLLKQLYDVVNNNNEDEEKHRVSRVQAERELKAA